MKKKSLIQKLRSMSAIDMVIFTLGIFVGLASCFLQTWGGGAFLHEGILGPRLMAQSRCHANEVKLLCWVLTDPKAPETRAIHVNITWGRRCDKLLFMSSENGSILPTIALENVKEGYEHLSTKTWEAFRYVYTHHFDEFDWFLKADLDTFVVVENLRNMLKKHDPTKPIYFGEKFKDAYGVKYNYTYMDGGAGYVLSKGALKRFVEVGLLSGNVSACDKNNVAVEDMKMGACMQSLGVEPVDSVDAFGRHTMTHFPLINHLRLDYNGDTLTMKLFHPQMIGYPGCCSDRPISFHCVRDRDMTIYHYLLNYVRFPDPKGILIADGNFTTEIG